MVRERAAALGRAIDLAEGRLNPAVLAAARITLDHVTIRGGLAPERTVVAFLGATGSGKSSLFNALTGREIAQVSAIRPTTSQALAASSGSTPAALLDYLEINERVELPDDGSGLVVVDLPDIDSVERSHRLTAARLAEVVDVLVWVVDPQKYADDVLHTEFIRPLQAHADVTYVVLNQIDTLDPLVRPAVISDLGRLLAADGIDSRVIPTSARTGEGIEHLREELARIAATKQARLLRARGDITRAARLLQESAPPGEGATTIRRASAARVVDAAAAAAGVPAIVSAVRGSYLKRARTHVGWVPVRWLGRLRPNPMRRLHLDRTATASGVGATSLPAARPIHEAELRAAINDLVRGSTSGLPDSWRDAATTDSLARIPGTVQGLDVAIADLDYEQRSRPWWWSLFGLLQYAVFAAAVVGGAWLGLDALFAYLQLPPIEAPTVREIPLPTVLLLGGLAAGILLALLGMGIARLGARRAAARTRKLLEAAVARAIEQRIVSPLSQELEDYHLFRESLELALRS